MQGVLILGGLGTRLNLFTKRVTNKALALVYDRLVLEYPLNTLVKAGITDIVCILGGRYNGQVVSVLGDGREFEIKKLTYVHQNEPKGISHAIYQAKGSIHDKCAVILGDNFFEEDISKQVKEFESQNNLGCGLFLKEVSDPERFGVAEVDFVDLELDILNSGLKINNIIEKPKNPPTNLAVTGLYFYDNTLFDRIETLKPSTRGELEVTDLNMTYVKENKCIGYKINSFWTDMGIFDSILDTANFVRNNNFKLSYEIDAWKKV